MKVVFIVPKNDGQHGTVSQFSQCRIFPPVGLTTMVGITGKKAFVYIVDERLEAAQHESRVDIAVIFINSYNHQRANDLAIDYHKRGCHVVFTGPVLSREVEKTKYLADSLFIGAGEDNISEFIADYTAGKTQRLYRVSNRQTMPAGTPIAIGNTALHLV